MKYAVKQYLHRHIKIVVAWLMLVLVYVTFGTNMSDYLHKDNVAVERTVETVDNADDISKANSITGTVGMLAASICILMLGFIFIDLTLDGTFVMSIADFTWYGVALCITCFGVGLAALITFINMLI